MKTRVIFTIVILAAAAFFLTAPGELAGQEDFCRTPAKLFAEVSAFNDDFFQGDLDGELVIGDPDRAYFIPRLSPHVGFGLSFGGMHKSGTWSVSVNRSVHSVRFQGVKSDCASNMLEVRGRGYLLKTTPIAPYLLLGFNVPWLKVRNGAIQGNARRDASYLGLGVTSGAGITARLGSRLSLNGGIVYRFMAYLYTSGAGNSRDVTNLYVDRTGPKQKGFLKAVTRGLELGVSYTF
ncbi:MAG TPA: hypothetical protein PLX50_05590 [Candidatus Aminicenantes bacterium]|nr:hypothetical protein [Candidatus Aminicenantes bacterium]